MGCSYPNLNSPCFHFPPSFIPSTFISYFMHECVFIEKFHPPSILPNQLHLHNHKTFLFFSLQKTSKEIKQS